MLFPSFAVGADLDGIFRTEEELFEFIAFFPREMFCDEVGVVESAGADVIRRGREGDEDDVFRVGGKGRG